MTLDGPLHHQSVVPRPFHREVPDSYLHRLVVANGGDEEAVRSEVNRRRRRHEPWFATEDVIHELSGIPPDHWFRTARRSTDRVHEDWQGKCHRWLCRSCARGELVEIFNDPGYTVCHKHGIWVAGRFPEQRHVSSDVVRTDRLFQRQTRRLRHDDPLAAALAVNLRIPVSSLVIEQLALTVRLREAIEQFPLHRVKRERLLWSNEAKTEYRELVVGLDDQIFAYPAAVRVVRAVTAPSMMHIARTTSGLLRRRQLLDHLRSRPLNVGIEHPWVIVNGLPRLIDDLLALIDSDPAYRNVGEGRHAEARRGGSSAYTHPTKGQCTSP